MAPRISLALAIHNHQPVGNFGWVIGEVFERAYEPLVGALERHPGVRLAMHYTGPLLEWLQAERPEFLERLRALVRDGRVEMMGGGLYEPVLPALPERDRVAQLTRMRGAVEAAFGVGPRGAWLAERVWEPSLPTALAAGGYAWTILDDAHFRAAAVPEDGLWGPYTTDDQGASVVVFGTEQGLRYLIPFREVDAVISHLRSHATDDGDRLGTMGDDGEKFGAWPGTWEHCWGDGRWVDRFFDALEANASWLTTVTPSEWLATHAPIGRVYLPSGSYAEMGEWALPAEEALAFRAALDRAREERRPEARWLRGAPWRNFQVRYREVNDLHKRMLRASDKVAAMPAGPLRDLATDHLHRGQSNDVYWHGLFGGLYLGHLRLATLGHLIAAEDLADRAAGRVAGAAAVDLDLDGHDEVLLSTPGQVVAVDPFEGGGIGDWDVRPVRHALTAVLRRRPEAYHARLRSAEAAATGEEAATAEGGEGAPRGVVSIHELVRSKEPGLAERLVYDPYERRSGLVRFLAPGTTAEAFAAGRAGELGDLLDGPFEVVDLVADRVRLRRDGTVDGRAVRVDKTIVLAGDRLRPTLTLDVRVENRSRRTVEALLGVEWATTMLGGGNPAAWWSVARRRLGHDSAGSARGVSSVSQGNDDIGITVATAIEPRADAWWSPIETISHSESGFERVYQGSALLFAWPVRLEPGRRADVRIVHRIAAAEDRSAAEADSLDGGR